MKIFLSIVLAITVGLCLAACSLPAPDAARSEQGVVPDIEKLDAEETYPQAPGSMLVVYKSMGELVKDAEYIAEIEVQSQEVILLDGFPRTHSKAKVITALQGDLNVGDVITIIEEGGKTADKGEAILGVPVMNSQANYILFLLRYEGDYFIIGGFQGKFIEKEGYVFQQATEDVKLRSYSPEKIQAFKANVAQGYDKKAVDDAIMQDSTDVVAPD